MRYDCLPNDTYCFEDYCIISIRCQDLLKIKDWRNEQIKILRQKKKLSDEDQLNYYNNVITKSFIEKQPSIVLFSYLYKDVCIGYGGLTNIDWESRRAEISFLVDTNRTLNKSQYHRDFSVFLSLMKLVAFQELKLNRLFTETFDIRPSHIEIVEENGFKFEGRMKQHTFIDGIFVDSLIHGLVKEDLDDV